MELPELLRAMENPHLKTIDLSLGRMERLLAALGSPEKRIPPVIHVAGTNGKGSLVAYLHAMFEAGGKRVHRYISPHLVRFNERIVLAGKEVADAPLLAALQEVHGLREDFPSTFFEGTTAAAFLLFAQEPADVTLLEVGLGGRLDATNVIANPVLTAITPISRDHEAFLGNTVAAIAAEKAAIMKPGVPCVMGPQMPEAEAVIRARAQEIGAPLYAYGAEWRLENRALVMDGEVWPLPQPPLHGAHQWLNAATAGACMAVLNRYHPAQAVPLEQAVPGIGKTVWPGRLQELTGGRNAAILPPGSELWLDGGHNEAAARMLAEWLAADAGLHPVWLVCGMVSDKDAAAFLRHLQPHIDHFIAVPIAGEPRSADPEVLLQAFGREGETALSAADALVRIAAAQQGAPCRVLVAGSLYLAGQLLAAES